MRESRFAGRNIVHHPHGVCQHCGWTQPLRKLTRHQIARVRRAGNGLRTGRWMCDECIGELDATEVRHGLFPSRVGAQAPGSRHRWVA